MSRILALADAGEVDARAWPALTSGLVLRGEPVLAVARLTGGTIALGRWQRSGASLTAAGFALGPVRRVTGGRAISIGQGAIGVALSLPHRSWLVSDDPEALPASRILNRGVRGILAGLGTLGVGAYYFGRDFVTVESSQAGYLSFEIDAQGHTLVECVLAAEAHWWLSAEHDARPIREPPRGVPGPGRIEALAGVTSTRALEVFGEGYRSIFGLGLGATKNLEPGPAPQGPRELPLRSGFHEIPAGFAAASAELRAGRIAAAAFEGDFLADSAGLGALEAALVGCSPKLESIATAMNDTYARAGRTLIGVNDLTVLADALVEACS